MREGIFPLQMQKLWSLEDGLNPCYLFISLFFELSFIAWSQAWAQMHQVCVRLSKSPHFGWRLIRPENIGEIMEREELRKAILFLKAKLF